MRTESEINKYLESINKIIIEQERQIPSGIRSDTEDIEELYKEIRQVEPRERDAYLSGVLLGCKTTLDWVLGKSDNIYHTP